MRMNVIVISVVPSPYQRDLFQALAARPDLKLNVFYLEESAPDSPWPKSPLEEWESILPGQTLGRGRVRCHLNWHLPTFDDADIVVINASLTDWTTQELMRRLTRAGTPWVFWGEQLRDRSGFPGIVQKQLVGPLRHASAIVAIGEHAARDFQRRLPDVRVEEIPYHCNITPFLELPLPSYEEGPRTFLFCGQMIHRKGIDILLAAFSALASDSRLILAGRGDNLEDRLSALSPAVRSRIDDRGFVDPDNLPQLYGAADAFVLPSRHDGWGVVINQALAAGLPIIATSAVGAAIDLMTSGREGFLIPPGDTPALLHAMSTLTDNAELCRRQSIAARNRGSLLHPERGAARWQALFVDLLCVREAALAN